MGGRRWVELANGHPVALVSFGEMFGLRGFTGEAERFDELEEEERSRRGSPLPAAVRRLWAENAVSTSTSHEEP